MITVIKHLSYGKMLRELALFRLEKSRGSPYSGLLVPNGGLSIRKLEEGLFAWTCSNKMALN